MTLRTKIIALAVAPLLVALALVALAVAHQVRDLAQMEHQLIARTYMDQRRIELRSYVELAVSTVRPLYDTGRDDDETRTEALRRLAALDYGSNGYFFVYDLQGVSLMHSRQPDLVGRNLADLQDSRGRSTIRQLLDQAAAGGGFVEYEWQKPSSAQSAPKLGYVTQLPRWNWMLGTGLYLDEMDAALQMLDAQMTHNVNTTMLWIAGIAALCLGIVSAGGLLLNLSEHRVAEGKLRQLARQVVRSQEEERAHLARELHDGTSQTLVAAKLLVESAVDTLERAQHPAPPTLVKALQRLNDTLAEIRRISHRLRPALLDTLGLPAALERLCAEFGEGGGAQAGLRVMGGARNLPTEVNTALFRVAQEALTNVRKHARAHGAHLVLDFAADGGVRLEVADDGPGFDAETVQHDPRRGIGLRNMRERLAAIGGRLHVHTGSDGTQVVAEVSARALADTGQRGDAAAATASDALAVENLPPPAAGSGPALAEKAA